MAVGKPFVHNAGQVVLPATAGIKKGPWHDTGGCGLIVVTTLCCEMETVLQDGLPLRAVRSRTLPLLAGLPVHNQVGDFMRDGRVQKVFKVLDQQLKVDAQVRAAILADPGLAGTTPTQGKVDCRLRQRESVKMTSPPFGIADGFFGKLQNIRVLLLFWHLC